MLALFSMIIFNVFELSVFNSGYGLSDGKCLPCSGNFGRAAVSSCSCPNDCKHFSSVKILRKNNLHCDTKRMPFACMATSSGHRRNPDFSRQSRQGNAFSRGKNRQNQENTSGSENTDEMEILSSRNGPLLSLSGSPRYQATATPGPREKEIVELFRKVQAQLRQRAAIKEEKKIEASQGQGERGTVDSLLKLLRKHSSEQGKKSSSGSEDFNINPPERNSMLADEQTPNFFDSNAIEVGEVQETSAAPFTRPASNFRRKSPVPKIKYQSVYSTGLTEESMDLSPSSNLVKEKSAIPVEPKSVSLDLPKEAFDEISESSDANETSYENGDPSSAEASDLGSLKVSELRVLAKSRGVKGFSKLKKGELLEVLSKHSG